MDVLTRPPVAVEAPAHAEPIGRRNLPIESLRGIAALGVVVYHLGKTVAWPSRFPPRLLFSNGDAGVTLFFVLSGFLLWRPFAAAALDGTRRPSTRQFAVNRALRIVPVYWVTLTLVLLFVSGSNAGNGSPWPFYLFLQNYSRPLHLGVIAPAWSLAVEAVFYLVLPLFGLLAFALCKRARTRAGRLRVQAALIGAWFALGLADKAYWALARHRPARDVFTWFQFPPKAHLFAFGMLLALWHANDRTSSPLRTRRPWIVPTLGAAIVVGAAIARDATFSTQVWFDTVTAVGFTLFVSALVFDRSAPARLRAALEWRPLVWTGVVSYPVYLVHERLLRIMVWHGIVKTPFAWLLPDLFVIVGVSLAVAWGMHTFVERPFLGLRKRWS